MIAATIRTPVMRGLSTQAHPLYPRPSNADLLADSTQGLQHTQHCRCEQNDQKPRKDAQYEREDQLHTRLVGLLLGTLTPAHTQGVGLRPQSGGDTGSKTIGLDQNSNETLNVLNSRSPREVPQCIHSR